MTILTRLKELAALATPGPWIQSGVRQKLNADCIMIGPDGFLIAGIPIGARPDYHAGAFNDAQFIVALVNALPDIIQAVEAMGEEVEFLTTADNDEINALIEIRDRFRARTEAAEASLATLHAEMDEAVRERDSLAAHNAKLHGYIAPLLKANLKLQDEYNSLYYQHEALKLNRATDTDLSRNR